MTIPNQLTLARLALTPLVAALAYGPARFGPFWALGVFLLAMATDVADGIVAKRTGQCSLLGLYLDSLADKIIVLTMFFVLADLGIVPLWMALLMMARELVVDGLRGTAALGGQVVGANWMGKTKGCLQTATVSVGLAMLAFDVDRSLAWRWVTGLTGLTLLAAWAFAAVFLWRNLPLLKKAA